MGRRPSAGALRGVGAQHPGHRDIGLTAGVDTLSERCSVVACAAPVRKALGRSTRGTGILGLTAGVDTLSERCSVIACAAPVRKALGRSAMAVLEAHFCGA